MNKSLIGIPEIRLLDQLKAEKGTCIQGFWPLINNPVGFLEVIPVIIVQGKEAGPTLWVQAAVHGEEFAASWAVSTLGREIDPSTLKGRLLLFPVAHMSAFLHRQKGSAIDGLDISHQAPGNPNGTLTQQQGYKLLQTCVREADAMIDVHAGTSTYFCIEFAAYADGLSSSPKAYEMAMATGSPVVLRREMSPDQYEPRMFTYATQNGTPGLMISIGGRRRVEEPLFRPLVNQCKNVMRYLGMIAGDHPVPDPSTIRNGVYLVPCKRSGFVFNQVKNGDWVVKGQLLVQIHDAFGDVIDEIHCPVEKAQVIETAYGTLNAGDFAIELFGAA